MTLRILTPLEARVLAVLAEKQATVPDSYPMSVNSLVQGCNQKTARHPVMNVTEADVLAALDGLKRLSLVFETSGSRVVRFEHNFGRGVGVPSQSVALLATLVLRGPLTAAELRLHTERLHRFADISSVEGFLDELAGEPARVVRLARAPGEREARWMHLLCGGAPPAATAAAGANDSNVDANLGDIAALQAEQARLAEELSLLREQLGALAAELGVSLKGR